MNTRTWKKSDFNDHDSKYYTLFLNGFDLFNIAVQSSLLLSLTFHAYFCLWVFLVYHLFHLDLKFVYRHIICPFLFENNSFKEMVSNSTLLGFQSCVCSIIIFKSRPCITIILVVCFLAFLEVLYFLSLQIPNPSWLLSFSEEELGSYFPFLGL